MKPGKQIPLLISIVNNSLEPAYNEGRYYWEKIQRQLIMSDEMIAHVLDFIGYEL